MNITDKIKQINKKKFLYVFVLILISVIIVALFITVKDKKLNEKETSFRLSNYSVVNKYGGVTQFSVNAEKGYLYKMKEKGAPGILKYVQENQNLKNENQIFPDDLDKNIELTKTIDSTNDIHLSQSIKGKIHYTFIQKINGIPIYESYLKFHLNDDLYIYAISGEVVENTALENEKITISKAKEIALKKASIESEEKLKIESESRVIINSKVLGITEDQKNYPSMDIWVVSESGYFSKHYFVSLYDGEILFEKNMIHTAKSRTIVDCKNTTSSCSTSRTEGSSSVGISDVDDAYTLLGDIYDYYFNAFSRDSIDGSGLPFKADVRVYPAIGPYSCPNAAYMGNGFMRFCPNLVKRDVAGHEFSHGVIVDSVYLDNYQAGALKEAIADTFGTQMDNNWQMGEGISAQPIRDLSNPPSLTDGPFGTYPDRVFSSSYYCGAADEGGIHHNATIFGKAFYLMTDGGSFNGCDMNGIGRERSGKIVYYALTTHLNDGANFKDMYRAMMAACNDLYVSEPVVCEQVKKALEATEMDQQPDGTQNSPKCSSTAPQAPACSGAGAGPTIAITPSPTGTAGGGGGGGTAGNYKVSGKVYIDVNNDSKFDSGDSPYKDAVLDLSDGPKTGSATTNASGDYVLSDYPSGLYTITLSILGSKKETRPIVLGPDQSIDFRIFSTKTEPTIVAKPTVKVGPTIGDGPTLTPTPVPHICEFDPKCAAQKKNLQLCKLICRPKT